MAGETKPPLVYQRFCGKSEYDGCAYVLDELCIIVFVFDVGNSIYIFLEFHTARFQGSAWRPPLSPNSFKTVGVSSPPFPLRGLRMGSRPPPTSTCVVPTASQPQPCLSAVAWDRSSSPAARRWTCALYIILTSTFAAKNGSKHFGSRASIVPDEAD